MKKYFITIIEIYQRLFSPFLRPRCVFFPTCSEYSLIALKEYGLVKGLYYTFKRISKCHPFGGHGYDPVPIKIKEKK